MRAVCFRSCGRRSSKHTGWFYGQGAGESKAIQPACERSKSRARFCGPKGPSKGRAVGFVSVPKEVSRAGVGVQERELPLLEDEQNNPFIRTAGTQRPQVNVCGVCCGMGGFRAEKARSWVLF